MRQHWTDSTCQTFAAALKERLPHVPDSAVPPVAMEELNYFPGFGMYYHPEGPLGAGLLMSGLEGVEGLVPAWPCGVLLPLYEQPGSSPRSWILAARLARKGVSWTSPLNRLPVIPIGQSENALLVYDIRPDGWLRVRYSWPSNTGSGTAWVHVSQLSLGSVPLTLVTWEQYLLNRPWPLVVFRDRGDHRMYAAPDTASAVLDRPEGVYGMRALEIRGEWMRVHRQRTSAVCIDPRKVEPSDTGWIIWRSPERGLLLWVEAWDC